MDHDHDYIQTQRARRSTTVLDKLIGTHPEFEDMMEDYRHTKKVEEVHNVMEEKGQILNLELIKENSPLFAYYTGLPSYETFEAVFHYLQDKAVDMQYVSQTGYDHHSSKFKSKPGRQRALTTEEEFFATLV